MLDLLLIIAIIIPGWYAYRRSVSHGLVAINHVTTFSFGFLFYWISPVLAGVFGAHFASRLSEVYFKLFDKRLLLPYLATCIGLYVCFAIGDSLGMKMFRNKPVAAPKVPRLALLLVSAVGCLLALYTAYTLRVELWHAYGTALTFKTARGTLTSCVVLLGVVALIYILDRRAESWKKRLTTPYLVPFLLSAAILLWLGNRLYVVSFVLMLAVYQTNYKQRLKLRTVLWAAVASALLAGAYGVWREQGSIKDAALNVIQEPVLTSLSLVYYLSRFGIAWTNSPVYLASDFLNLIPALIMPEKASLLMRPPVYNPLGGLHSFVSLNMNFGILGSAIFLFCLPVAFRYAKSRSSATVCATAYIMCTGWLAFTFFRDPFKVSLVKAMLQDSILMPIAIVAIGRLLEAACSRKTGVDQPPIPSGHALGSIGEV